MKRILWMIFLLTNVAVCSAQISEQEVDEVTVTGEKSIIKTDRHLEFPSKTIVEHSSDGYDLLRYLVLPGVKVDAVNKSVSGIDGSDVSVYINQRKATQADIIALRPKNVLYVEHITEPSIEYATDNVTSVINFVLKEPTSGLTAGINTANSFTSGNGNNMAYIKYNNHFSEFAAKYSMNYADVSKRHTDQIDEYNMVSGADITVDRTGINTRLKYMQHNVQLTYNLTCPKKYVFEANLLGVFYDSPHRGNKQMVEETGKQTYYALTEPTEKYHAPSVDLFYRMWLPKQQELVLSVVGTYIDTKYGYSYKTFADASHNQVLSTYGYDTDGNKYSFIGEGRYLKGFKNVSFLAGVKNTESYTKNVYVGDDNTTTRMNNSSTYAYVQLSGKHFGVNWMVGAGADYQHYSQDAERYNHWTFRPSVVLSYSPFKGFNINYFFNITPVIPSLAELSAVRQQSNEYEYNVGNPMLQPYHTYLNRLTLSYVHSRFFVENETSIQNSRNTIMEDITRFTTSDGANYWEISTANQKSYTMFRDRLVAVIYVVPNVFNLQGGVIYNFYKSKGLDYVHTHHAFSGIAEADLFLGAWRFSAQWYSRTSSLFGETIQNYGSSSSLSASYTWKSLQIGIDWSYIFQKDQCIDSSRLINDTLHRDLHVQLPSFGNLVSITFAWNISLGRSYESSSRNIYNSDMESGIMKMK